MSGTPQGPDVKVSLSLISAIERYDAGMEADAITVKLIEGEVKLSQQ